MMEAESSTLFVADIPFNIQESDFIALFQDHPEFITGRLRVDKNQNRVGFVDFESTTGAAMARERFQGHKFNDAHDGLNIHFSKPQNAKPKRRVDGAGGRPGVAGGAPGGGVSHGGYQQPMQHHQMGLFPPTAETNMPSAVYAYPHSQPSYSQHPYYQNVPNMNMYAPPLPPDATSCLYVEGLPTDATEREVSRMRWRDVLRDQEEDRNIFRPFAGYSSLRILTKESKQVPNRQYHLCFVEFDNKYQATVAMHALQGYRMDKNDTKGLHISYAKSDRRDRRRGSDAGPGGVPGAPTGPGVVSPAPAAGSRTSGGELTDMNGRPLN